MPLGPGGVGLDHGGISETVDDHAGKAIGLGMDQAVKGRVVQRLAQIGSARHALDDPVAVDLRACVPVKNAGKDLGIRVDGDRCDGPPLVVLQSGDRSRLDRLGAPVCDDLVVVDPRETPPDTARIDLGLEADDGTFGAHAPPLSTSAERGKRISAGGRA